jgi:hypothetical protein
LVSLFGVQVTRWAHLLVGRLRPHEHWLIPTALALTLLIAVLSQWRARR